MLKNFDRDLALAAERHADPEGERQADEVYAEGMERLERGTWHVVDTASCDGCGERLRIEDMAREVHEEGAAGYICSPCDRHAKESAGRDVLPIDFHDPFAEAGHPTCQQAGCTRPAETEYMAGWMVCLPCLREMSA